MPFTTNLTGVAEVNDSIRLEYDTEFRLAYEEQGVASQFATLKREIGAKSIDLPRYQHLALATSPLDEKEDVTSEALSDDKVVITPQEYGKVVTTTKLANLQTGGMVDRAAARLVGINAGRSQNKLALLALDAATNKFIVGGGPIGSVAAGNIMSGTVMGTIFNKLARKNVPGLVGGDFVMIAHDDVIHDIREGSGANSWIDAHKYALPEALLRNEVGMYKGFRVIRDNLSTIAVNAGAGSTVDVYNTYFMGFNALGMAESMPVEMRATGPFDKLSRFVNMGWHGVFEFKIVEQDAIWVVQSASSVGVNV
jgi:N4-gp56 family major capsid protein